MSLLEERVITHTLNIGEETFKVSHNDRRLYKFENWQTARGSLLKIVLSKLKESHDIDDAYIKFDMANPMRRSRLGNFYIDLKGNVTTKNQDLGTLEELGLSNISVDNYLCFDDDELEMRKDVEIKYSTEQYYKEHLIRCNVISEIIKCTGKSVYNLNDKQSIDLTVTMQMELEGWTLDKDNRVHARLKRIPSSIMENYIK